MIFTPNILSAASAILFVYFPSASALPAISSHSVTEARSLSNLAPTTNSKSNSVAWVLDRRSTVKTYTGKGNKPVSNTNTYKKATPPKAKPKVQSKSNHGANGRPPASQVQAPSRKVLANNVKRPNARPPASRVPPPPSRKMPTNVKRPTGLSPSQLKEFKPKNVGKHVFENPHHGTKSPIYAMSLGQMRYEAEPDEGSENDYE